jgi:hypothetical protein
MKGSINSITHTRKKAAVVSSPAGLCVTRMGLKTLPWIHCNRELERLALKLQDGYTNSNKNETKKMPSRETPHVSSRAHVDLFSFSSPSLSSYHVVLLHSDTIGLIPDGSFSPSTLILQVVVTQHVI